LSYQSIIAQWITEGKQVGYIRKAQVASVSVAGRRELSIFEGQGEIIALPCYFLFDSDKMGIQLIIDDVDTGKFFTVERLYSHGLIEYNGFIWCSRYETGYYAISIDTTPKSDRVFGLKAFNDDTTAHNILSYHAIFARAVAAPEKTVHQLLAEISEKLPAIVPPPPPPPPPPAPPKPVLKKPRFIPTRKRGVVEG